MALASIPDYDPNQPSTAAGFDRANRITTGVYEMGSVMKSLTTAMALDSGRFNINSTFDARFPMAVGRHQVKDFHAQRRVLTLPEVFTYSSNIGTSRMALSLGGEHQRAFLRRLGQFDRVVTEIGPSTAPSCRAAGPTSPPPPSPSATASRSPRSRRSWAPPRWSMAAG